jgi:hypothetical protein
MGVMQMEDRSSPGLVSDSASKAVTMLLRVNGREESTTLQKLTLTSFTPSSIPFSISSTGPQICFLSRMTDWQFDCRHRRQDYVDKPEINVANSLEIIQIMLL